MWSYLYTTEIFIFHWKIAYLSALSYPSVYLLNSVSFYSAAQYSIVWIGTLALNWVQAISKWTLLEMPSWRLDEKSRMTVKIKNHLWGSETMSEWVLEGWLSWRVVVWSMTQMGQLDITEVLKWGRSVM